MTNRHPRLVFFSSNPNKAVEAERILGIPLLRLAIDFPEIQAGTIEEITRYKLESAMVRRGGGLIVEDVALGLSQLAGFPGPYIRWLLDWAGGKGLAELASGLADRSARAVCCVGYWDGVEQKLFVGEVEGEVVTEPRGKESFGWDPWFVPAGCARTFGEMSPEEKDRSSHRGAAYRLLRAHIEAR
ncbi:MAG TPA: non-canonical purine NTP pyrophosphatase [Thermoanaerobaculia bacterium]|nr:non-canonical purine NTP pyrophosphatase [Thermoanaerobaculia bacterium]